MTTPHTSSEPQLSGMIDQHGQAVPLDVRQDGRPSGLVSPGKRTRFKIRAGALAYRVNRVVLPECPEHWHVCDISIGGQSVFVALGDSPEEDGVPGEVFAAKVDDCFVRFMPCQPCMDLVFDVTYHGPIEGGAPFYCHLQCTAPYTNEVSGSLELQLVDKWKDLAWRAMNAAALVTLVTSIDYPDALDVYVMIQQVLEGTSSKEQRCLLVRALEDRKEHLTGLAKDGDASPDPNLARAAQGLLPAVRTALGMLTKLPEFGPTVDAS
jgi:hypothetical protein